MNDKNTDVQTQYDDEKNYEGTLASQSSAEDDVEYEYVSVSEFIRPYKDKIWPIIQQIYPVIISIAIFLLCFLLLYLGRLSGVFFIIAAFIVLVIIAAIALYIAWKKRKETRKQAERAEMIYNITMEKQRKQNMASNQIKNNEELEDEE